MRFSILYFFLIFAARLCAQPSPALDPNYVTLQPSETFKGYYANQFVGRTIKTVHPLNPNVQDGGVFLNNVDTAGWSSGITAHDGPFRENNFSLFNKAVFRLTGLQRPTPVFAKGDSKYPVVAGWNGLSHIYYPSGISEGTYADTSSHVLISKSKKNFPGGSMYQIDYDNNGLEDLILIETQQTTTQLFIWKDSDLYFRGDSAYNLAVLPATIEISAPTAFNENVPAPRIIDIDKDGVWDILFIADSSNENGNGIGPKYLTVVFGKRDSIGIWGVDTTISYSLPFFARALNIFDFLYSDGIPDLLISSNDTMYCFNGNKPGFLRHGLDFNNADLKIPSPGKLDPNNFHDGGNWIFDWGRIIIDAGNFNGSGDHSLVTFGGMVNTVSLSSVDYVFVYSGGKAADERADAIIPNNETFYSGWGTGDTVRSAALATDLILGDEIHDNGRVGKIYYFKSDPTIPHKPDPRWSKSVEKNIANNGIKIVSQSVINDFLKLSLTSSGTDGIVSIFDLLGRQFYIGRFYPNGSMVQTSIDCREYSSGTYILTYKDETGFKSTKFSIIH